MTAIASNLGLIGVPGMGLLSAVLGLVLGAPATPSISMDKGLFGFLSSVVDDLSLAPTAPTSISNSEDTSIGTSSVGDLGFGVDMGLDLGLDPGLGSDDSDSDGGANAGGED